MNEEIGRVYDRGTAKNAVQIIGESVFNLPVLDDDTAIIQAQRKLLDIFGNQTLGAHDNDMFLLNIRIDNGYQRIKNNDNKVEVQIHHALKSFKRPKEGSVVKPGFAPEYEQMQGRGDYVQIEIDGERKTFVTSKKGGLQIRDVETGYTYVFTPEGLIGPFKYGCGVFQVDVDGGIPDKSAFAIPLTKSGGIDQEAKVYSWYSE